MDAPFKLTADEYLRLLANGRRSVGDPGHDPAPIVLLRAADGKRAWLLAEIDPDDTDLAFGLIDTGEGHPVLGTVRLSALAGLYARRVVVTRDPNFILGSTLSVHVIAAYRAGRIT